MYESARHFITVCPSCSTSVRVNRKHIGQDVICKHCQHTFRAEPTNQSITPSSGEMLAAPSIQPAQAVDRIAVTCPSCQTTLSVRRVYVGNQVRCKQCGDTFPVLAPAEAPSEPEESAPLGSAAVSTQDREAEPTSQSAATEHEPDPTRLDQLRADREDLQAAHDQLDAEHGRLRIAFERLQTEYGRLRDHKDRLTADLDTIRSSLGTISPAEVQPLAEERDSLRAEIKRLRGQINTLISEQSAHARLAAEFEQRAAELAALSTERDSLVEQVEQRDEDLSTARADRDLLGKQLEQRHEDLRAARTERDLLGKQTEQRDEDLRTARADRDLLGKQLEQRDEDLRAARTDRDLLGKQFEQREEDLKTADAGRDLLGKQLEQREQDLKAADAGRDLLGKQLKSRDDELKSARAERDALGKQLEQLGEDHKAARAEHGRLCVERQNALDEVGQHRAALAERDQAIHGEADTLRAEVHGLRQALDLAERTHHDDLARLNEQRHLAQEQAASLVVLRGASEQLSAQVESLRHSLDLAERSQHDEREKRGAELAAVDQLQSARDQVTDLERRVVDLERLNGELAGVLDAMGIKYKPMRI